MRFLTVAERELRAAARRKATHRVRWLTAVIFFCLLVWLLWVMNGFTRPGAAVNVFQAYSVLCFFYCIVIGTAVTADGLSAERREGTLGLLFLTNLNSAEIVAGKFCSMALTAVYGLAAILPMLALPLLMGGITLAYFWKTVLALVVTTFFSLSAGFMASVICRRQFLAIATALGLALVFGFGLMGAAVAVQGVWKQAKWAEAFAIFSPIYLLNSADGRGLFGTNRYWISFGAVSALSLAWLALVTWRLARSWRDQAKSSRGFFRFLKWKRGRESGVEARVALRRRLLHINPFFWLAGRRVISSPGFMLVSVVLVTIGAVGVAPYFSRTIMAGTAGPLVGHLLGWLGIGGAIHAVTIYFAAMAASQRLAEDKQMGALELILSTPTSERTISRGLWLAYGRTMFFPALLATLAHLFFIWQLLVTFRAEMPGHFAAGLSDWQFFWQALLSSGTSGGMSNWQMVIMVRGVMLVLGLLVLSWITIGWVGRWLGLRMKHPGFAPVVTLAAVFVPPILLFSIACYLADVLGFDQWPERQFVSGMMLLAFIIGVGHCVWLAAWARGHLRRNFRAEVMNRFQPAESVPWLRILRLWLRRAAIGAGASALALLLLVVSIYGYQNWRGQRRWAAFERQLKEQGKPLSFGGTASVSIADDVNFARAPEFRELLNQTNSFARLSQDLHAQGPPFPTALNMYNPLQWNAQRFLPLTAVPAAIAQASAAKRPRNYPRGYNGLTESDRSRPDAAKEVLLGLEFYDAQMNALALSAKRPFFQFTTNRSSSEFLLIPTPELDALERAQRPFLLRACAALELDRAAVAAEDVLTCLRLADFARQSFDLRATPWAQAMLTSALQPLWEGVVRHRWTESQLAALQTELARFNFLVDYTNAVPRTTQAYIESWQVLSRGERANASTLVVHQYRDVQLEKWQPRAWWLDHCIQLHEAGQKAIARVDVAAGRFSVQMDWDDFHGLPINPDAQTLLQQGYWLGANPALVAFAQTAANQAVIACASERYFLAHGQYPESLEKLQPRFIARIPNDPVRGRPMSYERLSERHYILRGFGPNEQDDRKNPSPDDWLWKFSTNSPAAK
jgi:ABC-type transport system involved in multi-copper enzyme maturation permease subunit